MDITSGAIGAGLLGFVYFAALQLKKWIPAGLSALKAKLTSGKIDLASIEQLAEDKVKALEQGALAELQSGVATIKADLDKLKTANPQLFPRQG